MSGGPDWGAIGALAWLVIACLAAFVIGRWRRNRKHPDPAGPPGPGSRPVPGRSPAPVDGQQVPRPAGHAPAPGLYGRCVMVTWFFDTGITLVHDRYRARWHVNLPPVDDEDIAALLDREATDGV